MFELLTQRLLLRDILKSDFEVIHELRSNPQVTKFFDYFKSENEQETYDWIAGTMYHNSLVPRQAYNLAIVRCVDDEVVGWVGMGSASDQTVADLNFGYAILPEYWRNGYAAEALSAVIDFAFAHSDVRRIMGECDVGNIASARVMEKAGLIYQQTADGEVQYLVERDRR